MGSKVPGRLWLERVAIRVSRREGRTASWPGSAITSAVLLIGFGGPDVGECAVGAAFDSQVAEGDDADRASSSTALNTARDLLIQATGIFNNAVVDLAGTIGRRVLADPVPDRRLRTRPRVTKRAISRYQARGTVDRTSYKATISINIPTTHPPDTQQPALATRHWG
ncbi:hypothetical protein ACHZ98_09885 [Streptomyces sp. MAR4 CNY-716]